ncbi:hypothetical protein QTN25_010171 [Entamoeba marina]
MNKNFTCSKCADWCDESSYDSDYACTHSADNCKSHGSCIKRSSDGQTCLECDEDYTLDNGKCYSYVSATGYDGKTYGCYSYNIVTYYDEDYDEEEELEVDFKRYEPVDGVCENPYPDIESSSSEVNLDSSTTVSSSSNSESNQNSENNTEDKGTGIVVMIGILLTSLLLL